MTVVPAVMFTKETRFAAPPTAASNSASAIVTVTDRAVPPPPNVDLNQTRLPEPPVKLAFAPRVTAPS